MEHLLLIIIGILLLIIFVLVEKVYFLRKSAQEIAEAFRDRLTVDTNSHCICQVYAFGIRTTKK